MFVFVLSGKNSSLKLPMPPIYIFIRNLLYNHFYNPSGK